MTQKKQSVVLQLYFSSILHGNRLTTKLQ